MKRIYYLSIIIAGSLIIGCTKNILNLAPNNQVASTVMWTTDNETDLGVSGVYAALRLGGSGSCIPLYELYSMDRLGATGQDYNAGNNDQLLNGTATPNTGYFQSTWQDLYEGIKRANDAIYNIPRVSPSDSIKKARYVAECKFLRAYFYFRLAELYHNVPIYTDPTAYDQFNHSSAPQDSVWLQCISDLTDAINTPTSTFPLFYSQSNANAGRVTKGAAYALRGEVYMWQKKYAQAIADFQQVQAAGYQLYTGAADSSYKMLFKQAQNNCAEMIFEMQNMNLGSGGSSYGGTTGFYDATRSFNGQGWSWYSPTNYLVDLYENADGSKFNWDSVIPGYNEMTPAQREVYFIRDNATSAELTAAANRGADISKYLPTGNEARIAAAYANRDPRLHYTVITPYSQYLGASSSTVPQTYTWRWPYRAGTSPYYDLQADKVLYCTYFYRKFVLEGVSEGIQRDAVGINYPIIRYADVLLQWAEAINESGGSMQSAIDLVNQVRSRARVPLLQTTNAALPTYVNGQADLRERIRNERRVEFVNEGVDYFDELRWGTWKQLKFSQGGALQVFGTQLVPYTWLGDYVTTWPVPATVVQMTNGKVAATPGWSY